MLCPEVVCWPNNELNDLISQSLGAETLLLFCGLKMLWIIPIDAILASGVLEYVTFYPTAKSGAKNNVTAKFISSVFSPIQILDIPISIFVPTMVRQRIVIRPNKIIMCIYIYCCHAINLRTKTLVLYPYLPLEDMYRYP